MKVYVSVENSSLYVQSNYLTSGAEYPTKISTQEKIATADVIAVNLVGEKDASGFDQEQVVQALPDIKWVVEKKLFADPNYGGFNFQHGQVFVIGDDDVPRPSIVVVSDNRERRVVALRDHLYAPADENNIGRLSKALNEQKFQSNEVVLMPLVMNSATLDLVNQSVPTQNRLLISDFSKTSIYNGLSSQRSKTVFLLGHVENGSFVVLDSAGDAVVSLPVEELQKYAEENGINIYALGCNSAALTRAGAATEFNTVDAVSRFVGALNSNTWGGFYSSLAGDNLDLVVDSSSIADDGKGRADIIVYKKAFGRRVAVGVITAIFSALAGGGSGSSSTVNSNSNGNDDGYPWWVWVGGGVAVIIVGKKIWRSLAA